MVTAQDVTTPLRTKTQPITNNDALPRLHVTFQVARLIKSLRRRVKAQVASRQSALKDDNVEQGQYQCEDLDDQTYEDIRRILGRTPSFGLSSYASSPKPSPTMAPAHSDTAGMIDSPQLTTASLLPSTRSLLSLINSAKDDKTFLDYVGIYTTVTYTKDQASELQSSVHRILTALQAANGTTSLVLQLGIEADELDDVRLANLEHMLLCLRQDIDHFLSDCGSDLFQKHVHEQQDQSIRSDEDWFSEFPNARHPLSTTWPWSIKPSLAVIWGVCWMFYNSGSPNDPHHDNGSLYNLPNLQTQQTEAGSEHFDWLDLSTGHNDQGRRGAVLQMESAHGPSTPGSHFTAPQSYENVHSTSHHLTAIQAPFRGPPNTYGPRTSSASQRLTNVTHAEPQFGPSGTNPPYTTDHGHLADAQDFSFDHDLFRLDDFPECQAQQQVLPQTYHRPLQASAITVNTSTHPPPSGFTDIASAPPAPQAPFYSYFQQNAPGTLTPQNYMTSTKMQSPVSIQRSREPSVASAASRPRAHSDASIHSKHSPMLNVASTPDSRNDEYYSPNSKAPERPDPAKNAHGQYICRATPECEGLVFDRKCEWSKHYDKHERPWRCRDPACSKLQGFTYSGGLLRHQREVHQMHGGPKEKLFCSHPGCKRHTDRGFTRKENRDEHERRVHGGAFGQPKGEECTSPRAWSDSSEAIAHLKPVTGKRKASVSERSESDIDILREEVKRLRQDNELLRREMATLRESTVLRPSPPQTESQPINASNFRAHR
ncbi:hypothetical protein C1H76_3572 [Elsinoe australis]|uniref:C2H2-domain containing protein first zinc finger domain-containing protein n=1 Tax=Elsinoe australis TaxID=40998 RepID=A0A4U7B0H9_9PEZI|nr:hypothetical protein C1H76_3572 [Elsinoe australis]